MDLSFVGPSVKFFIPSRRGALLDSAPSMEIIIKPTVAEAQQETAKIMRRQIQRKPETVLGLATGSTPIGVYSLLVAMHEKGELDFS